MNKRWDKACGADFHKRFIDATIMTSNGIKMHKRFLTNIDDLLAFRDLMVSFFWSMKKIRLKI